MLLFMISFLSKLRIRVQVHVQVKTWFWIYLDFRNISLWFLQVWGINWFHGKLMWEDVHYFTSYLAKFDLHIKIFNITQLSLLCFMLDLIYVFIDATVSYSSFYWKTQMFVHFSYATVTPSLKVYLYPSGLCFFFFMWKGHSLEVHRTNIQLKIFIK